MGFINRPWFSLLPIIVANNGQTCTHLFHRDISHAISGLIVSIQYSLIGKHSKGNCICQLVKNCFADKDVCAHLPCLRIKNKHLKNMTLLQTSDITRCKIYQLIQIVFCYFHLISFNKRCYHPTHKLSPCGMLYDLPLHKFITSDFAIINYFP